MTGRARSDRETRYCAIPYRAQDIIRGGHRETRKQQDRQLKRQGMQKSTLLGNFRGKCQAPAPVFVLPLVVSLLERRPRSASVPGAPQVNRSSAYEHFI